MAPKEELQRARVSEQRLRDPGLGLGGVDESGGVMVVDRIR